MAIMGREFTYMWRDRELRNILLVGPLLGLLLFYATYSVQALTDIPTAVADLDRSTASRELTDYIGSAENLNIVACPNSFEEVEELIKKGKIVVGVVIPENYGKNVSLRRQARVEMIVDGSNMIYATNATGAVLSVTRSVGAKAGVQSLIAKGVHPDQAIGAYQSISFREEPWFNPTLNYAYFVVLALALNFWQQCCTIAACMNIIGETGVGSWRQLKAAGVSKLRLFFCKSAIQICTFMLIVCPIYALSFTVFKLPVHCSFGELFLFNLAFVIALHSVGTLASSIAPNAVDATRFGMIVALPSFIVSGYTWPLEAMPGFVQQLAKIVPHTWFFQGINYLTFKNPGWHFMVHFYLAFFLIAVACYGAATIFTCRK